MASEDPGGSSSFDVFLSHNGRDKKIVERLAERLQREGMEPWLDVWSLTPGGRWQEELAIGILASKACAYFVGPNGEGDWEREELGIAQSRAAKDRDFRLFPVLLPGVGDPFDRTILPPFLSTRTWVDLRGGLDDSRAVQALINAIKGVPLGPAVPIESRDDVCPYLGLETFDEAKANLYFGRRADIQAILEQLKSTSFLAVLGPSGSGKSSLVRAGVIPELRRAALPASDEWQIAVLRPGARPLESLAATLTDLDPGESMNATVDRLTTDERTLHLATTAVATRAKEPTRLVWVVDQAEELFTLCSDEAQRAQFIANIVYAASIPKGPSIVILTLRADFYARCAAYPALSALLARQYLVGPMDEPDLREAIEEPARSVGLTFESGLVETILDDAASQSGTLPLLEHALLELWERRRGGMLTLEGYRASGGVQGALAQRADEIYNGLDPSQQALVRRTLLRLTQPGEGTEDTRRRATLREVAGRADEAPAVETVIQVLADARLVTTFVDPATGSNSVEISHEALIRGWPLLRKWLDEDRAALRVHRRITAEAEEWDALGREADALYRGASLAQAVEWQRTNDALLNDVERAFLNESIALQVRERAAKDRLRRRVTIASVLTAIALAVLTTFAFIQAGIADRQRQEAERARADAQTQGQIAEQQRKVADDQRKEADAQRREAVARLFLARAGSQETPPDVALLLSVEASRMSDSADVRGGLLKAIARSSPNRRYLWSIGNQAGVAYSPDGRFVASAGSNGRVIVWDLTKEHPTSRRIKAFLGQVNAVAFSPNGKLLASAGESGIVRLWDPATGVPDLGGWLTEGKETVNAVAFSSDGSILAAATGQTIVLWDVGTHKVIDKLKMPARTPLDILFTSVAFTPDGRLLAAGDNGGRVIVWDVAARQQLLFLERNSAALSNSPIGSVAFNADGSVLASAGSDGGAVNLWDVATGAPIGDPLRAHRGGAEAVAFSPDGKLLATAGGEGTVQLWDPATRSPVGDPLTGHIGQVTGVAFSSDGAHLASTGADGIVTIWDVGGQSPLVTPLGQTGEVMSVAISSRDDRVAVADVYDASVWRIDGGVPVGEPIRLDTRGSVSAAFDSEGRTLALGGFDGSVSFWDVVSGKKIGDSLKVAPDRGVRVAFSPDGKVLATGDDHGHSEFWDVERRVRLPGDRVTRVGQWVLAVAFSPDGKLFAAAGTDGQVLLWDARNHKQVGEPLSVSGRDLMSVAFSPDGSKVAAGDDHGVITIWDVSSPTPEWGLSASNDPVSGLAFSPDGSTLAATSAAIGPGGDRVLVLWDMATHAMLGEPLQRGGSGMTSVAFSHDGKTLVTGDEAGTSSLWEMDLDAWVETACRIADRNFSILETTDQITPVGTQTCPDNPVPDSRDQLDATPKF